MTLGQVTTHRSREATQLSSFNIDWVSTAFYSQPNTELDMAPAQWGLWKYNIILGALAVCPGIWQIKGKMHVTQP